MNTRPEEPVWGRVLTAAGLLLGVPAAIITITTPAQALWSKAAGAALGCFVVVLAVLFYRAPRRARRRSVFIGLAVVASILMVVLAFVPPLDQADTVPPTESACGVLPGGGGVSGVWGPDRALFTMQRPAPYPVINSIVDNPIDGDERRFFMVSRGENTPEDGPCSSLRALDGDLLTFHIVVENSAAQYEDDPDQNAARGVRAAVVKTEERSTLHFLVASVTADNTNPATVWSQVEIGSDKPFRLDLVANSTRVYSNASRDNVNGPGSGRLVHDLLSAPLVLGFEDDDGVIRPSFEHLLYLEFQMRVTHVS